MRDDADIDAGNGYPPSSRYTAPPRVDVARAPAGAGPLGPTALPFADGYLGRAAAGEPMTGPDDPPGYGAPYDRPPGAGRLLGVGAPPRPSVPPPPPPIPPPGGENPRPGASRRGPAGFAEQAGPPGRRPAPGGTGWRAASPVGPQSFADPAGGGRPPGRAYGDPASNGAANPNGHPGLNGYADPSGYANPNGNGGPNGGYGGPNSHDPLGYPSPSGQGGPSSHDPLGLSGLNGYAGPPNGRAAANGQAGSNGYAGSNGHGAPTGHGSQNGYTAQNGYGGPDGYTGQNGYGSQNGYGAQNGYGGSDGYGGQSGPGGQGQPGRHRLAGGPGSPGPGLQPGTPGPTGRGSDDRGAGRGPGSHGAPGPTGRADGPGWRPAGTDIDVSGPRPAQPRPVPQQPTASPGASRSGFGAGSTPSAPPSDGFGPYGARPGPPAGPPPNASPWPSDSWNRPGPPAPPPPPPPAAAARPAQAPAGRPAAPSDQTGFRAQSQGRDGFDAGFSVDSPAARPANGMPNGWSVGAPEHPATRLAALTSAPPAPGRPLPGAGVPPPGPPAAVGVGEPADHRQNGYPGGRPATVPGPPASWDPLAPSGARPPAELTPARLPMDPFATRAAAAPAPGGQDAFGQTGRPGPDPFGRDGRAGSDPFGPTGAQRSAPAPNGAANPARPAAPSPNDPFGVTGYGTAPAATASGPADPWSTANSAWAPPPAPAQPSWLLTGLSVENPNAPAAPAPTAGHRGTPTAVAGPGSGPGRAGGYPGAAGGTPSSAAQRPGDPFVLGGPAQPRPVAAGINVDGGPVAGRGPTGTNGPGGTANGFLVNGQNPGAGNGQLTAAGGPGHGHPTRNGSAFPQGAGPGRAPANGSHLGAGIAVGGGPVPDRPGAAPAGPWIVEGSADQRSPGGQPAQRLAAGQQAQSGQHLAAGQRFATGQHLAAGHQQAGQQRPGVDPRGAAQPAGAQPPAPVGPPTQAFDPLFGDLPFGPGAAPSDAFPGALTGQRPASQPAGQPGGPLGVPGGPPMPAGVPGGPTAGPSGPRPAAPGAAGPGYPARPPMPPPGTPGPPMMPGAPTAFAPLHDRQPDFQPSTQFPAPAPSPLPVPPSATAQRPMAPADGRAPMPPRPPAAPPGFADPRRGANAYLPTSPDPVGRSETGRGQAPPARQRPGRDDLDLFDVSSAPSAIQPAGPPPRRRNTSSDPGRSGLDISGPGRSNGRHATGHPNAALYSDALLGPAQETAARGWRKVVYQVSGGAVNPGPSPDEARHNRLLGHIRTPLTDCHRIAVMSLKGGVGKTTTTIGLGSTLADLRDDRVVAIDANPDRGTLGTKAQQPSPFTVRDLLEDSHRLSRYVDIRNYMARSDSRLDVLASADDPEISEAFADSDYHAVDDLLQRYYSILLTDCGTGMLHSAMGGVLALADTLVIVTSSSADGGTSASATLDWLDAHGYAAQVRDAVAVISMFPQNGDDVDVDALEAHFAARTRRVVRVPWDPHLATGGRISLHALKRETRRAYQELAAAVAERFAPPELDDLSYPGVNPYRDDRLFS
ncbi:AAA family ATPase [Pseudofrankia inefficax]|uniref:CobQ/CobB/MinD/ParA nucleotide binding domain-containing protein n=1 Tax=Pseudofrankia inefficax (strain DSM 45817 / CECT 9037 / DDB 130130 / EuI1c) TaxID=298654 RepID=E3J3J5_PSEI1|nr:AAA family ATPase [Pseudofrankia inefficax]ADP78197.1 hypothetical protein FraEuI1c_0109 [Pseudofrankia inefficax]